MHVKDPRFLMVEPDDGMRHGLILSAMDVESRMAALQGRHSQRCRGLEPRRVFQTVWRPRHRVEPFLLDRTTVDNAGAEGAVGRCASAPTDLLNYRRGLFGLGKLF